MPGRERDAGGWNELDAIQIAAWRERLLCADAILRQGGITARHGDSRQEKQPATQDSTG
jgi:hypothetical protein